MTCLSIFSDDEDLEDDEDDDKITNKSKGHWTKEVHLTNHTRGSALINVIGG